MSHERARWMPWLMAGAVSVTALNVAIWLAGAAPTRVGALALAGAFASPYGAAQTLAKATPLMLTGASVAFALRAGLFNVGAEGQVAMGVLAAAWLGPKIPASWPWPLGVLLVGCACALAGAALGGLAGWLKAKRNAHEVLTTLMLNGLAAVLTTWLYGGPMRLGAQVHTAQVSVGARLPTLDRWLNSLHGSALSLAVILALCAPWVAHAYLQRTTGGLRIRALGASPTAARALGISVAATQTRTMAISGALAGLCGVHYVLGFKGYAEDGLGAGVGFAGIAVAMLGAQTPWGIVAAALFFGALAQGGLSVNAVVPSDTLALVQSVVLVSVGAVVGRDLARRKA
ncbi:MAG: ABC transporter permease [Deltaproteobacteria bacterium]|nr:ABC transporter permease [Deltaproteobacteria bacterium]